MKQLITFLTIVFILSLGFVLAHSDFESSIPQDGALLDTAPTEITLNFKEDIQPDFSVFKVYALPADMIADATHTDEHSDSHADTEEHAEDSTTEDHGHSETEHGESSAHGTMDAAATVLIPTVIDLQGDEDARADAGLVTTDKLAKSVTIALKENLAPGAYVVMFRALSADTHMIEGYITFEVKE